MLRPIARLVKEWMSRTRQPYRVENEWAWCVASGRRRVEEIESRKVSSSRSEEKCALAD